MTDSSHRVRALQLEDVPRCAEILYALPEWFGLEAANRAYVENLRVRSSLRKKAEAAQTWRAEAAGAAAPRPTGRNIGVVAW